VILDGIGWYLAVLGVLLYFFREKEIQEEPRNKESREGYELITFISA